MKKLSLLFSICVFSTFVFAQEKPNQAPKDLQKDEVFIDVDVDVEESESVVYPEAKKIASSEIKGLDSLQKEKRAFFFTLKIYGDYEWFFEENKFGVPIKFGILYNRKVLFPIILNTATRINKSNHVIIGIDHTYGLFNLEKRTWEIPMQYKTLHKLKENTFLVQFRSKYGIIDNDNNIITNYEWDFAQTHIGLDDYLVVRKGSKPNAKKGIYCISEQKLTVPCEYETIIKSGYKNEFSVKKNFEYSQIDERGNVLVPPKNKKPFLLDFGGGYFARNMDGKFGYLSKNKTVVLPYEFDYIKRCWGRLAIISKENKFGIIKIKDGVVQEITPNEYDNILFAGNVFIIEKDKKFGLINRVGKKVKDLEYDRIEIFSSNLLLARKEDKWNLMNKDGKELMDTSYQYLKKITNKENVKPYKRYGKFNYLATQNEKGDFGIIDKKGKEIVAPRFEEVINEADNFVVVKENGKYGLYNLLEKKYKISPEFDQLVIDKKTWIGFKEGVIFKITKEKAYQIGKL